METSESSSSVNESIPDSLSSCKSNPNRLLQYKNNSLDVEEIRRRREEHSVELRKQKRDEHIRKRRTGSHCSLRYDVASEPNTCPEDDNSSTHDRKEPAGDGLSDSKHETVVFNQALMDNLCSSDPVLQKNSLNHIRYTLSTDENPPIYDVIKAGFLPVLVSFLKRTDDPELQFESAWALTNILSGNTEQTEAVIIEGAVPLLIHLISSPYPGIQEQAVWALGNMAGDSCMCRDVVLGQGIMLPLLKLIEDNIDADNSKISLLRNGVWCLSNLCRNKYPPPDFAVVSQSLHILTRLLFHKDADVLTETCWSIGYLADGPDTNIQAVIDIGVVKGLIRLFLHNRLSVVSASLRAIGNIVTGDDLQTQLVINSGVLPGLGHVLTTRKREAIKKEVCWILSNITAGNKRQIQAVIDANLIPLVVELLSQGEFKTRKEAAWVFSNAASGGTVDQVEYMVSEGCLYPLSRLTTTMDVHVVLVALTAIEHMLKTGQFIAAKKNLSTNPVADKLEECGGIDHIESLQAHENRKVYELAYHIIDKYLTHEGSVEEALSFPAADICEDMNKTTLDDTNVSSMMDDISLLQQQSVTLSEDSIYQSDNNNRPSFSFQAPPTHQDFNF